MNADTGRGSYRIYTFRLRLQRVMQYDGDKAAIRQILPVGQGCKALMLVNKCINCKRHHQTDKNHRFFRQDFALQE